jgi:hypothetical protein
MVAMIVDFFYLLKHDCIVIVFGCWICHTMIEQLCHFILCYSRRGGFVFAFLDGVCGCGLVFPADFDLKTIHLLQ